MRVLILLTLIIVNAGCTTLRPIEGSPAELRQQISVGELLKPGDRVLIVTADQKTHRFAVTAIGSGEIEGRKISLPVEQIVSVERREFSRGKTIGLVCGIVGAATLGGLIYAIAHVAPAFALQN